MSKKARSRHVLQSARSKAITDTAQYIVMAMVIAALALVLQGFFDPSGRLTQGIIPKSMQGVAGSVKAPGAVVDEVRSTVKLNNDGAPSAGGMRRLSDVLHLHRGPDAKSDGPADTKAVVVHHDPDTDGTLSTEVHAGEHDVVKKHAAAKRWEEMEEHEQHWWREKLVEAGMWTIEEGETILKGIFFGQAGALIGRVAAEALG